MADDAATPDGEPEDAEKSVTEREPVSAAMLDEVADVEPEADVAEPVPGDAASAGKPISHERLALIAGMVAVLVLAGLTGWLGFRADQSHHLAQQRELFLQVGRQGAVNLTTLDFEHIDADVRRILDSATGSFYDDFHQRAPSFTDVVKQVKSRSQGTVTAAALESDTPTEAEVLVAITVKTEIVGQPEQRPRSWRMRILVQKVDDDAKVSNVEFVA